MSRRALRRLLASFLLLTPSLCFPAPDLGGNVSLLWIVPESFSDWESLDLFLKQHEEINLTLGLFPGMLTPAGENILPPWIGKKRLEIALRLKGDPLLPRIAENPLAPRPQDAVDRLASAREQYRLTFGSPLAGFVPAAGAVSPPLFSAFHAMQLSWVAIGDYPGNFLWSGSGLDFVPFKPVGPAPGAVGGGFWVLDESRSPLEIPQLGRLKAFIAQNKSAPAWKTVSAALKDISAKQRMLAQGESWPAWGGDLELSRGDPQAREAEKLYSDAAKLLETYQNSGAADLKPLEEATELLYLTQASRYYRKLPDPKQAEALTREFKGLITAIYLKLGSLPPTDAVYVDPAVILNRLRSSLGGSWIAFDNPKDSISREPTAKILGLRVEWDDKTITLIYKMAKLQNEPSRRFGEPLWQTYIDINHIAGAGSTSLLDNSSVSIQASDAWEYALTASNTGAFLYRSGSRSAPVLIGQAKVRRDAKNNEVRVIVVKELLKGNPLQWGYISGVMGADPGISGGSIILGLLGPLEEQKSLLEKSAGPRRLEAVRAGK